MVGVRLQLLKSLLELPRLGFGHGQLTATTGPRLIQSIQLEMRMLKHGEILSLKELLPIPCPLLKKNDFLMTSSLDRRHLFAPQRMTCGWERVKWVWRIHVHTQEAYGRERASKHAKGSKEQTARD